MAPKVFTSSASASNRWIYDVFLSFRGETRKTFTDHLFHALKDAGINTFRDNEELRKGENLTSELIKAIQGARISIIVFSRNYASSRWCLEELVKIMECRKNFGQRVLPIFYDVDPSDVRYQKGSFETAFAKHEKRYALQTEGWKAALAEAADLSGWNLKNVADGHEAKFIKKIVRDTLKEVEHHTSSFEIIHPVGLDSRVREMTLLLNLPSNDVRIVGICGMGGSGKTTIAKALFNQLFHNFEVRSFIANVKEMSEDQLQERLLSDILTTSGRGVRHADRIPMIKRKLSQKRVILILDDVDELDKLNAVAGNRDWFGSGSRIIITTRDQDVLKRPAVDEIYIAEEMNSVESLKFFSLHAFGKSLPTDEYAELAADVAAYSGGLPLALKVLGSFLSNKSPLEWESTLEKLKNIPDKRVDKVLRISYNSLSDDSEKNIFLDISCFFIGMDADHIVQILNGCGFYAQIGLRVLIQRCLVTISESNKLMMHDLLRDMGREIVREESLNKPAERSRLWRHEDVIHMLTGETGTTAIEGLILKLPEGNDMNVDIEEFSKMRKLRLLQLHHVQLNGGGYKNFSKELRWLCWHGFPLKFIPNDIHQGNLVALDMRYSKLRQIWKGSKMLEKLKFLNLSHSHCLTQTPEFSRLPNLEELKLKDCRSLVQVHDTVGSLPRLVLLNVKDCKQLVGLPGSFCKLKSLKTLILSGCSKFDKLPEDLGDMGSLETLLADNTAISRLPITMVKLTNLKELSLGGYKGSPSTSFFSHLWSHVLLRRSLGTVNLLPPSLQGLCSLQTLILKDCSLSDDAIPNDLWSLSSLKRLNLEGNSILSLPAGIAGLSKLVRLVLNNCTRLKTIADLPLFLGFLEARNCTSLERLPNLSNFEVLGIVSMANCHNINEAQIKDILIRGDGYILPLQVSKTRNLEENKLEKWVIRGVGGVFLPGSKIPYLYTYQKEGSAISFNLGSFFQNLFSFSVCCVCSCDVDHILLQKSAIIDLINFSKCCRTKFELEFSEEYLSRGDQIWKVTIFNALGDLSSEDEVAILVRFHDQLKVKEIGIRLIFGQISNDFDDEHPYASLAADSYDEDSIDSYSDGEGE